jgi:dTDP-4-amino-4,6-dideoxygalactose transaminase
MKYIPYGRQLIDNEDRKSVLNSLSNDLITTGPLVEKFEKELKKYFECKYSYTCSSGTAAIHLAMLSIGLKKNDIILMPAVNFIASYNIAKIMKLRIYLVDVDENTGQVTASKILQCLKKNKLKKIKALLVMYHAGFPENPIDFYTLKKKYKFFLIEDACHAFGAEYKYKNKFYKIGSCKHADVSTFSLHPVKTITSGEGGVITTNSNKVAKKIQLLRSHGILRNKKKHWDYDIVQHGFNYRLSDINCALGLSQLNKIDSFLIKREKIYRRYVDELKFLSSYLELPNYSKVTKPAFHLFLINIKFKNFKKNKRHLIKYFLKNNIFVQQHYIPIYKFKVYKEKRKYFPETEKYFKNSLSIPLFVNLSIRDQIKIIKVIKNFFFKKNLKKKIFSHKTRKI